MRIAPCLIVIAMAFASAQAADWPMWRCEPARTASSDQQLPDDLHLQWVRKLPPLEVAWPDQDMMWFDRQYEPVVAGQRMFVGSSQVDSLSAYDTRSGERLWEFRAEGPIRFAPVAWNDKLYVASDDGHLYCVSAADGRLVWKHRGGPSDRRILGNERLISLWPARGGPVVAGDTVYYAAGIWPFMGIFLHALDAETGVVRWTNDGEGSRFTMQPHNTPSFAGVAPQGALVIDGDRLLVPGGRSVPACFDRHTGRLLHYELARNNKNGGGSAVAAGLEMFFNGGITFGAEQGDIIADLRFTTLPVVFGRRAYYALGNEVKEIEFADPLFEIRDGKDRKGKPIQIRKLNFQPISTTSLEARGDLIRAGDKLFGCSGSDVFAIERSSPEATPQVLWKTTVDGTAARLLAADDRLFVVTVEGSIYCFAADKGETVVHHTEPSMPALDPAVVDRARRLLSATNTQGGYTVVWGVGDGSLVLSLLQASDSNVIAVEPDANKANALRTKLVDAGLYGRRATVVVGTPESLELPQYLASSMIVEDAATAGVKLEPGAFHKLFASLRPFGGGALFHLDEAQHEQMAAIVRESNLPQAEIRRSREGDTVLVRSGPLPGSADWTHEHADAANTRVSRDDLVKTPLGILWFGGPSHDAILPRHGHGPQPQVVEGRVIIEGPDTLRATDVYTGRLLWERKLPGIGALYNNTMHHAGANGTGANYISLPDGIYAIYPPGCLRLDPATGATMAEFQLPPVEGEQVPPTWNYVNATGDYLVAAIDLPESLADPGKRTYADVVASKRLFVLNRHDGRVVWSTDAQFQFRNNAICIGGGRLYCIDLLSNAEVDLLKRRGQTPKDTSRLTALDLATGRALWSTDQDVFGTWLSYSAKHDVLVESGRPGRDVLRDEPPGMRAYRAADGGVIWKEGHRGPAILHGERILADRQACELLTGKLVQRDDPLTGRQVDWIWNRNHGCNTPQASQHLLLFRSGAAGYCDLTNDGGTGNFGGFRSSCSNNLIAAGGVLSVPEYTRTCTCDYQNQTSLALVHMPDVEVWTEFPLSDDKDVRQVALNLGAPGFRRAADGTLWLNNFAGAQVEYDEPGYYCRHSSAVHGDGKFNWVAASGCRGIRRLTIDPGRKEPATFTVRLHFCDPDNEHSGSRVFDVSLQGRTVLAAFDPAAAAGGVLRPIVKEFHGVQLEADKPLLAEFTSRSPVDAGPTTFPILNGIELIVE
ncbi:MAG: PQQ-binding-like beta-propeller repeat protein [Pirellulales bacterium]